jgi:hypothetical protein
MTLLERRIERVQKALREAQQHLDSVKERECLNQGAFLCEVCKSLPAHSSDLQRVLVRLDNARRAKSLKAARKGGRK